jgi:hypothetical protein
VKLTEQLLEKLSGESADSFKKKRLDAGGVEGDPCMLIQSSSISAVAFPYSDNLDTVTT